jgi:hypothetical protein
MDEDAVICARAPFAPTSEAVVATFTADFGVPVDVKAAGYEYFLGKHEVAELLKVASAKQVTRERVADFVCYYAEYDAYPQWFYDLADR